MLDRLLIGEDFVARNGVEADRLGVRTKDAGDRPRCRSSTGAVGKLGGRGTLHLKLCSFKGDDLFAMVTSWIQIFTTSGLSVDAFRA